MESVGAYDAKTNLPKLLERAARGARITVTKHGRPVAEIVPPREYRAVDARAAVAAMKGLRKRNTLGGMSLRELIDEGRRF
jgi:prevent-host-death family protein